MIKVPPSGGQFQSKKICSSSQVEANRRKKNVRHPKKYWWNLMKEVLFRNWVWSCLIASFWKTWDCDCFRHLPNAGRLQIQALGLGPFNPSNMREWPKKKYSWQQMVAGSQWIREGKKDNDLSLSYTQFDLWWMFQFCGQLLTMCDFS